MVKRISSFIGFIACLIGLTSCPRYQIPEFCDVPRSISVSIGCYDTNKGLALVASQITGSDTSVRLRWSVFVRADTSAGAPFLHPELEDIASGYTLTIADNLLRDNKKIYVELRSDCKGLNNGKASGQFAAAFVKRYNKATGCYQWGVQPF